MCGIKLSSDAAKELEEDISSFYFVDSDVVHLNAKTKHLDIHSYAEAMSLTLYANTKGGREAVFLFKFY